MESLRSLEAGVCRHSGGWSLESVVTPEPRVCLFCSHSGVWSLGWSHPRVWRLESGHTRSLESLWSLEAEVWR